MKPLEITVSNDKPRSQTPTPGQTKQKLNTSLTPTNRQTQQQQTNFMSQKTPTGGSGKEDYSNNRRSRTPRGLSSNSSMSGEGAYIQVLRLLESVCIEKLLLQ